MCLALGKSMIFSLGECISEAYKSKSSVHGMEQVIELMDKDFNGLCFVNLVDFDALWGHRRNPVGYGQELERFDSKLGIVLDKLNDDDLLLITADHGNDPTFKGNRSHKRNGSFNRIQSFYERTWFNAIKKDIR